MNLTSLLETEKIDDDDFEILIDNNDNVHILLLLKVTKASLPVYVQP